MFGDLLEVHDVLLITQQFAQGMKCFLTTLYIENMSLNKHSVSVLTGLYYRNIPI